MAVFESSFETEDFSEWDGTETGGAGCTCTVVDTDPVCGDWHAKFDCNETGTPRAFCYKTISLEDEYWFRFYVKIVNGNLPDNGDYLVLFRLKSGGADWLTVSIHRPNSGPYIGELRWRLWIKDGGSSQQDWGTLVNLGYGDYYCVEVYFKRHSTEGSAKLYVDNNLECQLSSANTYFEASPQISFGIVALSEEGVLHTVYGDCFVADLTRVYCIGVCQDPTVVTNDASDVGADEATLNGNIIDIGGEGCECDERGFEWGEESGVYPNSWTETNSFGVGTFNHQITSLECERTYYYRAKAHNSSAWAYGSEKQFTTSAYGQGRMNAVKQGLISKIQTCDATLTVVDELKGKIWDYSFPLVSVRLMFARTQKYSYGSRITSGRRGVYTLYRFTLHVFAEHSTSDQLKAKDVQQIASNLIKYLRKNNRDEATGILDIYDVSYRESDPQRGAKRYSRVIVGGYILAERPFGT